jgi:integrase
LRAVDLDKAFIDYPRPKTGIARRCPLWPETVEALREALDKRREPKSGAEVGLFFVTKYGQSFAKDTRNNPVTKETSKLLRRLGINGHRNFYALRHTFRTVADESKDQPAVDYIMGHADPSMAAHYRERIDDSRLLAVAEHVRLWLFGDEPDGGDNNGDAPDGPPDGEGDSSTDRRSPENCSGSYGCYGAGEGDERPVLRLFAG